MPLTANTSSELEPTRPGTGESRRGREQGREGRSGQRRSACDLQHQEHHEATKPAVLTTTCRRAIPWTQHRGCQDAHQPNPLLPRGCSGTTPSGLDCMRPGERVKAYGRQAARHGSCTATEPQPHTTPMTARHAHSVIGQLQRLQHHGRPRHALLFPPS